MIVIVIPPEKGRNRREGLTMTTMTMTTTISSNNRCMHTKTMVTAKTTTTDGCEQKPTNSAESSGGVERRSSRPAKDSALDRRSVLVAEHERETESCADEERVGSRDDKRKSAGYAGATGWKKNSAVEGQSGRVVERRSGLAPTQAGHGSANTAECRGGRGPEQKSAEHPNAEETGQVEQ